MADRSRCGVGSGGELTYLHGLSVNYDLTSRSRSADLRAGNSFFHFSESSVTEAPKAETSSPGGRRCSFEARRADRVALRKSVGRELRQ